MGLVYSTDPGRQPCPNCERYPCECEREAETRAPDAQRLDVRVDRKRRRGKSVTLVEGFVGKSADLTALAKTLKKKLGKGGTAREGTIEIQGEDVEKVASILRDQGYEVRTR